MSSKLKMVLLDSGPAIKMVVEDSDDLVDTVFKMFSAQLGHISSWCRIDPVYFRDEKAYIIKPVKPDGLSDEFNAIADRIEQIDPDLLREQVRRLYERLFPIVSGIIVPFAAGD
jgi:hypothetical protein